jgi:hypothetical protein
MKRLRGLILLAAGIALAIAAATAGSSRLAFARSASRASGTVLRLNAGGSHPEIEFATESGERLSYPQGGLIFGYRAGEEVSVLYDPENPASTACVDAFGALWFAPLLMLFLGSALCSGGVAALRSARAERAARRG